PVTGTLSIRENPNYFNCGGSRSIRPREPRLGAGERPHHALGYRRGSLAGVCVRQAHVGMRITLISITPRACGRSPAWTEWFLASARWRRRAGRSARASMRAALPQGRARVPPRYARWRPMGRAARPPTAWVPRLLARGRAQQPSTLSIGQKTLLSRL